MGKLIGNREAWHSFPAGLGLESNWGAALLVLLLCRGEGWGAWSPRPGLLGAFPPPGTLTLSRNRKFLNYTSTVLSIPPPSERVPPPPTYSLFIPGLPPLLEAEGLPESWLPSTGCVTRETHGKCLLKLSPRRPSFLL